MEEHPQEAELLHAAHDVLRKRKNRQQHTEIIHVYSHLDTTKDDPKMKRKLDEMRGKFGAELYRILARNEAADKLAREALDKQPANLRYCDPKHGNRYKIVDRTGDDITDLVAFMCERAIAEKRAELSTDRDKKYAWLQKKGIDWHQSAYLGRDTKRSSNAAQRHASKAKRNMFADKASRSKHENNDYMNKQYKGIQIGDDRCDVCRELENREVIEDREHYLHCKGHEKRRKEITVKVVERLNKGLKKPILDVPCYWNEDEKHRDHEEQTWRDIEAFNPKDASQALIPKVWVTYIHSLDWKPDEDKEAVIADCQRIIVEGLHKCWIERCRIFYKLHKPAKPTPDPTPPRQKQRRK